MIKDTILIIDDDLAYIASMADILETEGYNILTAYNGNDGFKIACTEKPLLIILDWNMPVTDGIETLKALKKTEISKNIPVIMCTGEMTNTDNLLEAYNNGVIDFIRKPFDKMELIVRVKSILLLTEYYNEILNQKNNELANHTLSFIKANEFNNEIIDNLNGIINKYSIEDKNLVDDFQKLIYKINLQKRDDSWNNFKKHFITIYPYFQSCLLKLHSDLTPAEIKLATLLKLNLNTKEIASILNQNSDSVRVSRTRLRHKLNLESDDNLTSYIMSI